MREREEERGEEIIGGGIAAKPASPSFDSLSSPPSFFPSSFFPSSFFPSSFFPSSFFPSSFFFSFFSSMPSLVRRVGMVMREEEGEGRRVFFSLFPQI